MPAPSLPGLNSLRRHSSDAIAAVAGAIAGVADGMAASVIIGVAPVHGLYASAFGPIIGGLTARSAILIVTTTGSASLAAAEVVRGRDASSAVDALLVLTLLAGLFQLVASAAGLARLTSFVSHSVMTGFLLGIAVLIIAGQLGTFLGYTPSGANAVAKTADLAMHAGSIDPATTATACVTVALLLLAPRLRLKTLAPIIALALPSLIAALAGWSVETVADVSPIPSTLPAPSLPDFSLLDLPLITGALALAAIVFVQTAGVSQGLPGGRSTAGPGRDLAAAGIANVGVALFQGQPVGGSLGQSALNLSSGARSRWAAVGAGLLVLVIILALGSIVELVAMPSLAALLIVAAVGALDLAEGRWVWQAGWGARLTILFTFVLTLLVPIQFAVAAGCLASAALYLSAASTDVHIVELQRTEDGALRERAPPDHLPSNAVTVLQVYGSLFYAGARTLARCLPAAGDAERPAVILRLRGEGRVGATLIDVLAAYAAGLQAHDGRLYLAGVGPQVKSRLSNSGKLRLTGVQVDVATEVQGESLALAYDEASAWLTQVDTTSEPDATPPQAAA